MIKQTACYSLKNHAFVAQAFHYASVDMSRDIFETLLPPELFAKIVCSASLYSVETAIAASETPFLFFSVQTDTPVDITVNSIANGPCKLWVNQTLVTINQWALNGICNFHLPMGTSWLIYEFMRGNTRPQVECRVNLLENERADNLCSIFGNNFNADGHGLDFVYTEQEFYEGGVFSFSLLPRYPIEVDLQQDVKVTVMQRTPEAVLKEFTCRFFEKAELDTDTLDPGDPDEATNILLRADYVARDGRTHDGWAEIFLWHVDIGVRRAQEAVAEALPRSSGLYRMALQALVDDFPADAGIQRQVWYAEECNRLLTHGDDKRYTRDILYTHGVKKKYFHSEIDGRTDYYHISLPQGYSPKKAYPLLAVLGIRGHENHSSTYQHYRDTDILVADVSCRGVTTGSYVGECAIFEILRDIRENFAVDPARVYLMGFSNGAYAAWATAIHHPDIFAGITAISGTPYRKDLRNISGKCVVNISSKEDNLFARAFRAPLRWLREHTDYHAGLVECMTHSQLGCLVGKKAYVDILLENKLDTYPRRISFRTESNRYLSSYWVRLGAIPYGKRFSQIECETTDDRHIRILTSNVQALTLTLPPYLKGRPLEICFNHAGAPLQVEADTAELHFRHTGKGFVLCDTAPEAPISRKGLGILDVYLDPVRIVAGCPHDALQKAAHAFSQPSSNGFDANIDVCYPIIPAMDFALVDSNLIIVDACGQYAQFEELSKGLPIQMEADGFTYNGHKQTGGYCVMQIVPNPCHPSSSIVYAGTNQPGLYGKNLFTRKVILPSYSNGRHPFWNNEALVFFEGRYFGVYEWGQPMEEIL